MELIEIERVFLAPSNLDEVQCLFSWVDQYCIIASLVPFCGLKREIRSKGMQVGSFGSTSSTVYAGQSMFVPTVLSLDFLTLKVSPVFLIFANTHFQHVAVDGRISHCQGILSQLSDVVRSDSHCD